jgi:ketosteroid isomerase-like protein
VSSTNISLVQSLYAAFGRGDIATLVGAVTPDAHWEINGRRTDHPLMGVRRGPQGVQEFFTTLPQIQTPTAFSPQQFFASEDKVFVVGHYAWSFVNSGKSAASDWLHMFTIKDGKVAVFREFTDTAAIAEGYRG